VTRIVVVPMVRWIWRSSICMPLAQLGIRVRQRLIEPQHARPDHQRAGERHALLLATGHAARITLLIAGEPDHRQRGADALIALGPRHAPHLEAKGDVLSAVICGNSA
jgi:hypothetical protein